MSWHAESVEAVRRELDTDDRGLSTAAAERRLADYGPNELDRGAGVSPLAVFLRQFRGALVALLVVAAVLSVAVGFLPGESPDYVDAALILLILLVNGLFGFVQDYRAEQSMQALQSLARPTATVRRDGDPATIPAHEVVPGDVVLLEAGDAVPADARLLSAAELRTDESTLTGESGSVRKTADPVDADAPLAERADMLYMHTTVVHGRGTAVVVATGMDTEVGAIATQLEATEKPETPFQREVDALGRRIGVIVVALIAVVAATQLLFTATAPVAVLLVAITLAVAAVPEGLPAVVTLTLALGSRQMLRRDALVRSLPVVESLGAVDTIVTDKTGTLTEDRMTVTRVLAGNEVYDLSAEDAEDAETTGSEAAGVANNGGVDAGTDTDAGAFATTSSEAVDAETTDPPNAPDAPVSEPLGRLLACGAYCNNAEAVSNGDYHGDPTEVALLVAAAKAGIEPDAPRLREIPFDSERKRMTVVVDGDDDSTAYTKGAPSVVLDRCDRILDADGVVPLTDERREAVLSTASDFAADALRVLGFAYRPDVSAVVDAEDAEDDTVESGLVFLGLQGMIDPPRAEVAGAVADCRSAGIRVVMATGDDAETAKAVGRELGFDAGEALTGPELDALSADELAAAVRDVDVFARVDPSHKVDVLTALQRQGHVVAMTGDGVNDAPALRSADVGVAMGRRGTEVARRAADMVLRDDNFVTIRDAVAEGRGIFDNIRKFVNYLLSANAGEVLVVFLGVLLGVTLFPDVFAGNPEALILTPVMLLWLNLVTDGLPALALGVDPKSSDVMDRPPRDRGEPVVDRETLASVAGIGVAMAASGLGVFGYALVATDSLAVAQTALFTFLVAVELVRTQLVRRPYRLSPLSNPWLLAAVGVSFLLQLALLYSPLSGVFDVRPLGLDQWLWVAAGFVGFLGLGFVATAVAGRVTERTGRQ